MNTVGCGVRPRRFAQSGSSSAAGGDGLAEELLGSGSRCSWQSRPEMSQGSQNLNRLSGGAGLLADLDVRGITD